MQSEAITDQLFVSAQTLASRYEVESKWIYARKELLGASRRGRLVRFHLPTADEYMLSGLISESSSRRRPRGRRQQRGNLPPFV
jgi:hypothetical protein